MGKTDKRPTYFKLNRQLCRKKEKNMAAKQVGTNTLPAGFSIVGSSTSNLAFQNAASWNAAEATGTMVQGVYEGRLPKDNYGKSNFKFTATADGETISKDGDSTPYKAGTTIIINEAGNLAFKMEGIEEGVEVLVRYDGQLKIRSGQMKGKMSNIFSVAVKK
jgi:hypothetical protein